VAAGVVAQMREGLCGGDAATFRDHALGLLDDDAARQCALELRVEVLLRQLVAVLEDGDGGDVGERLGDEDVIGVQRAHLGTEEVEGTDDVAAQAHRDGVSGAETHLDGDRGEPGPASIGCGEVLVDDRSAALEGVEAGSFVGLQFEQLDEAHRFAGRRDELELPGGGRQHDAGGGDVEHVDTAVGQRGEKVDDVEVVDERVGEIDHRAGKHGLAVHDGTIVGAAGQRDAAVRRQVSSVGSNRNRRATTSSATSETARPTLKAWARSRSSASVTDVPSCTATIPAAW
jgi:hypothetical protein